MSIARWSLESARRELALTRSQMAAVLQVEWADYLNLERAGTELPLEVQQRIMRLLEAKVERAVLFPAAEASQFQRVERGVVGQVLLLASGVGTAIVGGAVVVWSGHVGVGILIMGVGLFELFFAGQRITCRSCGARVGVLSMLRGSCSACGSSVRLRERSRNEK
jgi:DNA-binding XRE family transcriptional regulator